MLRLLAFTTAGLLLAGCGIEAEIARNRCTAMGIGVDHPGYADCAMRVYEQRERNFNTGLMGLQRLHENQQRQNNRVTCVNNPPFTNCW